MSNYGTNTPKRRADLHRWTDGRCFYCGIHVQCEDEELPRDWMVVVGANNLHMVPEHATPISRGGTDRIDNILPACLRCNSKKGSLTLHEYARWSCLRNYDLNSSLWGHERPRQRDWLHCYTEPSVIFKHNDPQAVVAFGRGKIAST